MKNLTLITILILTFITGDTYSQPYFGKSLFKDRIQANNVRYVTSLAQGTNEYATITAGLSAYQTGDLIILAPEYFDEDVTISIDNVHIQGLSKELSKIKSLTVTGSDFIAENFAIVNDASFLSQETWDWFSQGIQLNNLLFLGNVYFGNNTTTLTEAIISYDCDMVSNDNDLTINLTQGNSVFHNFRIQPTSIGLSNDVIIYGGKLDFKGGRGIFIDTLEYKTTNKYSQVSFHNQYPMAIGYFKGVTSTAFHVLVIHQCVIDLGFNSGGTDFIFNGLFELDIFNSSPALWKNIVFNSTANSRIVGMQQRGWQSTSQISGTGLNKLRIYNSSLSGTAPVGLADDRGNVWSAFMDN